MIPRPSVALLSAGRTVCLDDPEGITVQPLSLLSYMSSLFPAFLVFRPEPEILWAQIHLGVSTPKYSTESVLNTGPQPTRFSHNDSACRLGRGCTSP